MTRYQEWAKSRGLQDTGNSMYLPLISNCCRKRRIPNVLLFLPTTNYSATKESLSACRKPPGVSPSEAVKSDHSLCSFAPGCLTLGPSSQWLSTFLMLQPFNTSCCGYPHPTIKLFYGYFITLSLLLSGIIM